MKANSLISVIIPCYNDGNYLHEAIESILVQSYKNVEIIVVDDGSTDNTKLVVEKFPQTTYIYQANQGVSSARNTGIVASSGDYICFLDADDWLLPQALETNLQIIEGNKECAFVSGGYISVHMHYPYSAYVLPERLNIAERFTVTDPRIAITKDHYQNFLKGNYIGMHATVLYRRWVFDEFKFDTALTGCEDYDLFLKISRKYPVLDHAVPIAAYRFHTNNATANTSMMLHSALAVLDKQKQLLRNIEEEKYLNEGSNAWKKIYSNWVYQKMISPISDERYKREDIQLLWLNDKKLYFKYRQKKMLMGFKKIIRKATPDFILRELKNFKIKKSYTPSEGKVNMGDLARTEPFSRAFGYDRGGPVDRYYIEEFLEKNSMLVKGRVLEVGDNDYTLRFGGVNITQSDILHINHTNPKATFIGDLANAPHLPGDAFDCIVLTQTLQFIYDYKEALKTCYRILKPGGCLLLTAPGITSIDVGEWKSTWYWAFTDIAIKRILEETFSEKNVVVEAFGNVLTATAFLYGMGLPELKKEQLDFYDPSYQVIITAIATK